MTEGRWDHLVRPRVKSIIWDERTGDQLLRVLNYVAGELAVLRTDREGVAEGISELHGVVAESSVVGRRLEMVQVDQGRHGNLYLPPALADPVHDVVPAVDTGEGGKQGSKVYRSKPKNLI